MIIFKVTHLENNKVYVGYSINNNSNFMGSGKYITRALRDFGRGMFKREVLEQFGEETDLLKIIGRLEYWIRKYNADVPLHGYNENIEELIPVKKKLTRKLQVLITPEHESQLNEIIIEKAMQRAKDPVSISKYVRELILEHIVEENKTEN
tara:strand:- start:678 stop:1130 length:453 start_codon:yes stop_codon:yes gene_type:complete